MPGRRRAPRRARAARALALGSSWKRSTASQMFGRSKPRTTTLGVAHAEPLDDLLAHGRRRGRGQREHRGPPSASTPRRGAGSRAGSRGPTRRCSAPRRRRAATGRATASSSSTSVVGELLGREEEELERVLGELGERLLALGGRHGRSSAAPRRRPRARAGRRPGRAAARSAARRRPSRRRAAARRSGRWPTCPSRSTSRRACRGPRAPPRSPRAGPGAARSKPNASRATRSIRSARHAAGAAPRRRAAKHGARLRCAP